MDQGSFGADVLRLALRDDVYTVAGVPLGTHRKRRHITRAGSILRNWTLGHEHKLLVSESGGNPHMIQGNGEFAEGFRWRKLLACAHCDSGRAERAYASYQLALLF